MARLFNIFNGRALNYAQICLKASVSNLQHLVRSLTNPAGSSTSIIQQDASCSAHATVSVLHFSTFTKPMVAQNSLEIPFPHLSSMINSSFNTLKWGALNGVQIVPKVSELSLLIWVVPILINSAKIKHVSNLSSH